MRLSTVAVLVSTLAVTLHAQDRGTVKFGEVQVLTEDSDAAPAWRDALARAKREKKPILAFEKPAKCTGASASSAVECRLEEVVLVTRPAEKQVSDLAVYDESGALVGRLGGLPRNLASFESVTSGSEAPLTVGLVFDTSDSMCSLHARGSIALHDAMIVGLLQFEGVKGRRAMIVFSDGDDRASRFRAKDIEEMARRSNIPIDLIAAPAVARPARRDTVSKLPGSVHDPFGTRESGAAESWTDVFAFLAGVIRGTGGLVAIDVEVGGRNRGVRAPGGYYAPW